MLNEIFVASVYVSINMSHQIIVAETIQTFIIVPMTITCAFGIHLYDSRAHCHLYLFNSIENQQTQPAVKTIKVYYVFEMNIFAGKVVFGILTVLLKRISVCAKPVVANIKQISGRLTFIIENKPRRFSRATCSAMLNGLFV